MVQAPYTAEIEVEMKQQLKKELYENKMGATFQSEFSANGSVKRLHASAMLSSTASPLGTEGLHMQTSSSDA